MEIKTNGQRNITLDFNAPKKFRLLKDGQEIPYLRTGKNSFRLGRNVEGVLNLEEIIEQPKIVKPMQLQAQQMALVNTNDVLMINQAAQQLEVEQNLLSETQKRVEQTQDYLDVQQQRINETVLSVHGLETNNSERITATENGIFNLAGNLASTEQNLIDGIGIVNNSLQEHKNAENPHGITKNTIGLDKVDNTSDLDKPISKAVQSALDEKADKDEIQAIRDELGEYQEKNDRFTNALSNYTGGLAGNQLPDGGLQGQILAKRSDMSGDAEWIDNPADITVDDELSLTSENPVQNKVITSKVNNLETVKQDKLTQAQLDAVNSGANTTNIGQIATNTSDISSINDLIPNQASSSNQLADKSFVNSSINNMAAFYITSDISGDPFATRASLIAGPYYFRGQLRTPTQNDYALVSEDETHDNLTSRYMYDGGQWVWQYTLNNTKFTQAQIDAINSGITNVLVAKISTNETAINNHIANKNNPHEVTKSQIGLGNVDNTSDLSKPISTATQNALNGKQDTISDLATIRSGATLGSTSVQPSDLATVATSGSYNDLSDKPTIPEAQVNADWNATSGVARILNKPIIPTVPTNVSAFTNDAGYITNSSLNGYATQAWVGQQGYITGITSSDVTTALGYTPYNSSNPSGFITSSALVPYALSADLASVATSGSYNDLSNKPAIPTVNNPKITLTQGGTVKGSFTLNQQTGATIDFDAESSGGYYPDLLSFQWSDHLLNNVSWLRADTFSWQDGTVYSSAYNKLVEEYQTGTEEYASVPWVQPVLTSNGVMGGDSFAVSATSELTSPKRYAYMAFDGLNNTKWGINNSSAVHSLTFYNPKPLKVKKITQYFSNDYPNEDYGTYTLYGSTDNENFVQLAQVSFTSNSLSTVEYNVLNPDWYQYYKIEISGSHYPFSGIGDLLIDAVEQGFLYKHTTNGFNIAESMYESDVADLYNLSGVAWFYILDEENQRFKLPRTKYGFTGLRDNVGDFVEAGLPDIKGTLAFENQTVDSGAFAYYNPAHNGEYGNGWRNNNSTLFDAKISSIVYGRSDTVQPSATQMYLYFYVGDYTQTALEQTAGLNAELFNSKADISAVWTPETSTQQQKETIIGWGMPDYSAGVSKGWNNFTAETDGVIYCYSGASGGTNTVSVNGSEVYRCGNNNYTDYNGALAPVSKNDVITVSGGTYGVANIIFYPLKGAN